MLLTIWQYLIVMLTMKLMSILTSIRLLITLIFVQCLIVKRLQSHSNVQMNVLITTLTTTLTFIWTPSQIIWSVSFMLMKIKLLRQISSLNLVRIEVLRLFSTNIFRLVSSNVRMMMVIGWLLLIMRQRMTVLVNASLDFTSLVMDHVMTVH